MDVRFNENEASALLDYEEAKAEWAVGAARLNVLIRLHDALTSHDEAATPAQAQAAVHSLCAALRYAEETFGDWHSAIDYIDEEMGSGALARADLPF